MKKILCFILFVFFNSLKSNAQKIDTITSFDYDTSTHQFIQSSQQVFKYNGSCFLTKYDYSFFDTSQNKFNNYLRTTNSLLANNATSQSLTQLWNEITKKWDNYQKSLYTYTSNTKQPSTVLNQTWNTSNSSWVNNLLYTYFYDANGNDTGILIQNWNATSSNWINYNYYKSVYNNQNNITEFLQLEFNNITNNWKNYLQVIYQYNNQNKLMKDETYKWVNNTWRNIDRNTYYYDANNFLINYQYDSWDTTSNMFNASQRFININNANGTASITYTLNYNADSLTWDTLSMDLYSYNSCILPIHFIDINAYEKDSHIAINFSAMGIEANTKFELEKSIDGSNFKSINTIISTNKTNYTFIDNDKTFLNNYYRIKASENDGKVFYSKVEFIQLKNLNNNAVKIFPNPAINGFININFMHDDICEVYNLIGARLKTINIKKGNNLINLSSLNDKSIFVRINNHIELIQLH